MNTLSNYLIWREKRDMRHSSKTLADFAAELAGKLNGRVLHLSPGRAVVEGPLAPGDPSREQTRTVTLPGPTESRRWRYTCGEIIWHTPSYAQLVHEDATRGLRNQLVAACHGTEEPFLGSDGRNHWIYCYNPALGTTCWYCFETDMSQEHSPYGQRI